MEKATKYSIFYRIHNEKNKAVFSAKIGESGKNNSGWPVRFKEQTAEFRHKKTQEQEASRKNPLIKRKYRAETQFPGFSAETLCQQNETFSE